MSDIIEVKETPLSDEEIQRDYVDIKGAAQIFGNVSEKTARRYIASAHGVSLHFFEKIVNGGVGKFYRKSDIIAVAEVLNKIPSAVRYETVTVRQTEPMTILPKEDVTEALSLSVRECLRVPGVRIAFWALMLQTVLIIFLCVGGFFLWRYIEKRHLSMVAEIVALNTNFEKFVLEQQAAALMKRIEDETAYEIGA